MGFDLNVALGFTDVETDGNFVKSLDNEEEASHIQPSKEGGIAYDEEFVVKILGSDEDGEMGKRHCKNSFVVESVEIEENLCSTDEVKNDNINSEEFDILSTDSLINDIHEDDFDENVEVGGENNKDESSFCDIEKKFGVGSILSPNLGIIYKLYCEYAHCKGFSVRKGEQRYFGKTTNIRWKEYLCSSSGLPDCRSLKRRVGVYKKMVTRTNCEARLRVVREDLGPFVVSLFETSHNHELVSLDQCYLLRSNRTLNHGHQSVLESMQSAGIGVSVACKFMEKESGGISNVGFTRKDAYHHMDRLKRATKVENGDAQELHKYFTDKANSEPYFFWKYELDDDGKLMNFFFRDSRSALDFATFGDVVSVDTTYRTNRYNLICAPFVGINHHSSNVLFGMAFMSDETTSSFKWLFESFIESMDGKEPKVIFTDQCQAMMNAIDSTFTSAKHRLCQWHINQNAPSHFGKLNGNLDFKRIWYKCMNHVDTEAEFEDTWRDMIETYSLGNNRWFSGIYKLRHRWASVFTKGIFTAGLLATSRSESTNKVLKEMARCSISLFEFVKQYEVIQTRWRRREREEDAHCRWLPGQYVEDNDLLMHAASVYTRTIYKSFEYELKQSFNVILHEIPAVIGANVQYIATSKGEGSHVRNILYNPISNHACCTCRLWESEGILCRHIVKVYYLRNVFQIPEELILKRWSKSAKQGQCLQSNEGDVGGTMEYMLFVNQCMRHVYDMASGAKDSKSARALLIEQLSKLRLDVWQIVGNAGENIVEESDVPKGKSVMKNPKKIRQRFNGITGHHWQPGNRSRKRSSKRNIGSQKKLSQTFKETQGTNTLNFMDVENVDCESDDDELYTGPRI